MPRTGERTVGFADDAALARALKEGHPGAPAALFDRYGPHVEQVLAHVLGPDPELPDLLHEVFARAFQGVAKLRDGDRLKGWLTRVAVFTARGLIRTRRRKRWLTFAEPERVPEMRAPEVSPEVRRAATCVYEVLEQLPGKLRIPFALRYVQGMQLMEVAASCDVSLATIKRRIARAEREFRRLAAKQPDLADWLGEA